MYLLESSKGRAASVPMEGKEVRLDGFSPMDRMHHMMWVLSSPRLWAYPTDWSGVLQLMLSVRPDWDFPPVRRQLGRDVEGLWKAAFEQAPGWTVLLADEPIVIDGVTLGAPDFLVRTPEGKVVHLELAMKFYLRRRGTDGHHPSDYWGPGRRDRLDRKLRHMQDRQMGLMVRRDVHRWLRERGIPAPDEVVALMSGVLFDHVDDEPELPPPMRKGSPRGRWCELSELRPVWQQGARILQKTDWLGGALPDRLAGLPEASDKALRDWFEQGNHGAMIEGPGGRVMVVPDGWSRLPARIEQEA